MYIHMDWDRPLDPTEAADGCSWWRGLLQPAFLAHQQQKNRFATGFPDGSGCDEGALEGPPVPQGPSGGTAGDEGAAEGMS